jgi:hypothetical protein
MWGYAGMLTVIRYVTAVLAASIIGEAIAIPAAVAIDIIAGSEVTGGRWPLNLANVVLVCFKGAIIGCVAGTIAKKRGALVSAIAVFIPLEIFIAFEIIRNRDMSEYLATIYDTKPALWVWIALIPAMISGHYAAKAAQQSRWLVVQNVGMVILLGGLSVGAATIHLYTTYAAYMASGIIGAIITFAMPPASEIYWFVSIWYSTGIFLNLYTARLLMSGLLTLVLLVLGGVLAGIGGKYGRKRAPSS